jgi:CheY-like chemotaxis protein
MIESEIKILAVEDSTPDRLRLRSLFEMSGNPFCFAWNSELIAIPKVDEVMNILNLVKPETLILDLSWTVEDDIRMKKMIFKDIREIEDFIEREKKNTRTEDHLISGFRLLNKLEAECDNNKLPSKIFITTQYIPPVAFGLKHYIVEKYKKLFNRDDITMEIFHKWRDEKKIRESL